MEDGRPGPRRAATRRAGRRATAREPVNGTVREQVSGTAREPVRERVSSWAVAGGIYPDISRCELFVGAISR